MKKENVKNDAPKFTKAALAQSAAFGKHRDIITALFGDGEYTAEEAEKAINAYLNKKIKGGM
ncbi:MAG: hypothetical protein IKS17_10175 [Firmicutes bacterium]|nr:hypothetical protein [Bacillota bacterium]